MDGRRVYEISVRGSRAPIALTALFGAAAHQVPSPSPRTGEILCHDAMYRLCSPWATDYPSQLSATCALLAIELSESPRITW